MEIIYILREICTLHKVKENINNENKMPNM